ncbi:MAG TPA: ribosome maturation factor RimP, partial [Armatimonadetes bacterium]|nr:ribosome maturation factor RimP [Armatimonadota bacterium]
MTDWSEIERELEELLAEAGYELVDLQRSTGRSAYLTLFADRLDEPGTIGVEDCATLSRLVGRYLDQVDPFRGAYRLQVSSPGVDRPLRTRPHFERAMGQVVRVRRESAAGARTFQGRLVAVDEAGVRL